MTVGLLHTAEVHIPRFDALLDEQGGAALSRVHQVDAQLLADALEFGLGRPAIADRLAALLRSFSPDVDRILCTCSTLGGLAEELAGEVGRQIVRVDRPLAFAAVTAGKHLGLAFAVASTVEPTVALLQAEAERLGVAMKLTLVDCTAGWPQFLAGDQDGYLSTIAAEVSAVVGANDDGPGAIDVVVLAQASMSDADARLQHLKVPVLSSPPLAVEALLA